MTQVQKRKYETFVRVRDYGMAHKELFPESSQGGQAFGQMATIDDLLEARMLARAEARRVKSTTRAMASESLKTIAHAARRAARPETENHPFHIPRRRSLTVVIATARTFIDAARKQQELFARFDLPPAFISDLEQLTDALQRNVDDRLSSKSTRSLTGTASGPRWRGDRSWSAIST